MNSQSNSPGPRNRLFRRLNRLRFRAGFTIIFLAAISFSPCQAQADSSFLPMWRLLNSEQKQQFIAGYFFGWQDAAKVTDIALGYIKENPQKAVEVLESLRGLYGMGSLKPAELVQGVDEFYADPDNKDAALSVAVSSAKRANN